MSKPRKPLPTASQIVLMLLTSAITFAGATYWHNVQSKEALLAKQHDTIEETIRVGAAVGSALNFMSNLSCELGSNSLSLQEQNARGNQYRQVMADTRRDMNLLNEHLERYFKDEKLFRLNRLFGEAYNNATNDHANQMAEATKKKFCDAQKRQRLYESHLNIVSDKINSMLVVMRAETGRKSDFLIR